MSYGLAGHPPALLRRSRDGKVVRLLDADGPVMGPIRDATYTEGQVRLEPGDILVMYTDGLVERRGRDIATGISQAQRLLAGWRSEIALAEGCRNSRKRLPRRLAKTTSVLSPCGSGTPIPRRRRRRIEPAAKPLHTSLGDCRHRIS